MANLFGFGLYGGALGHYFKFHVECNTHFGWLGYVAEFNEQENGVRLLFELCKVQMFMAISSNIQDLYNYTSSSMFIAQDKEIPDGYEQYEQYEGDEIDDYEDYEQN